MFGSIIINNLKAPNRLPTKTQLCNLEYLYRGQIFNNVVSKEQETKNLETLFRAQIFTGNK
jgi:hypothetical protein